jgi:hypothetical protein
MVHQAAMLICQSVPARPGTQPPHFDCPASCCTSRSRSWPPPPSTLATRRAGLRALIRLSAGHDDRPDHESRRVILHGLPAHLENRAPDPGLGLHARPGPSGRRGQNANLTRAQAVLPGHARPAVQRDAAGPHGVNAPRLSSKGWLGSPAVDAGDDLGRDVAVLRSAPQEDRGPGTVSHCAAGLI